MCFLFFIGFIALLKKNILNYNYVNFYNMSSSPKKISVNWKSNIGEALIKDAGCIINDEVIYSLQEEIKYQNFYNSMLEKLENKSNNSDKSSNLNKSNHVDK